MAHELLPQAKLVKIARVATTSMAEQPLSTISIPQAFQENVLASANAQMSKAIREVQSDQNAHTLRLASRTALSGGNITQNNYKADTTGSRDRNRAEHRTASGQNDWARWQLDAGKWIAD